MLDRLNEVNDVKITSVFDDDEGVCRASGPETHGSVSAFGIHIYLYLGAVIKFH